MTLESENSSKGATQPDNLASVDEGKKTILIYSPDLNFCFSLSMLFQDRYNVVTTTSVALLETFVTHYSANLLIVDASPTEKILERLRALKHVKQNLPIIMLYVFSIKESTLDQIVRNEVDSVFYKPFDLSAVSRRIDELLPQ